MKTVQNTALLASFILLLMIGVRLNDPKPVEVIRAATFDYYQRVLPRKLERFPITIIDIDEKSLAEIGQWPWPRTILVALLEELAKLQPLVIGFDMIFPEPDRLSPDNIAKIFANQELPVVINEEKLVNNDLVFAGAISNQPVVLGTMLGISERNNDLSNASKTRFNWNQNPKNYIPSLSSRISNLPELEQSTDSIGVLNLLPEVDGVVRRVPTLYRVYDEVWPSFGIELLRAALFAESVDVVVDQAGIDSITIAGIKLPTNKHGLTWLQFNQHQEDRFVSAVDIINGQYEPDLFFGHIFLIGTSASGLHDIKKTPMTQQMPGVEIWAQWLESALFGNLLERPNYALEAEILFLLFSGFLLILLTIRASARSSLFVYLLVTLVAIGFSWWMYTNKFQLFDVSFPVMSVGVLFAWLMLMKFWQEEKQRKEIKNAFSHYLSPSIVNELASDPSQLKLGGELREITCLFTDLQGFTKMSEKVEPEELVELINHYLDGICQIVINQGGTIDKIVGDAVHAMFGAPKQDSKHAENAVNCALQIDQFCRQFQVENSHESEFGETRIGVNSGLAVVGNFGGKQRFDYTAYGDTINTAARLESANQYLGTTICVSNSTKKLCANHVFRPVADITVKGRSESIMVYEPLASDSIVHGYFTKYSEIFFGIQNQTDSAIDELKKLHDEFPNDKVIERLLDTISQSKIISVKKVLSEK